MYKSLRHCATDLERTKQLVRIKQEVDPNLEMAEIHRRVFDAGGPALLFENVKGSPFQAISNIYGTLDRTDFIFRKTLDNVKRVTELKADPSNFFKNPLRYLKAPFTALNALPRKAYFNKPSNYGRTTIGQLPQVKSWPMDGGAFVTLPQVFTLPHDNDSMMQSNLGMYRIQLSGNDYIQDEEIGLHYQIHRGIGVHHVGYNNSEKEFKASIFVGGPPSHAFGAIMPMPEGLSELTFAGMLAGRPFKYFKDDHGHIVSADADFVITGTIQKGVKKPEGPFGDHLGYYSLEHEFPYMKVDRVYHRQDPLWHFTAVGRPPQEDSSFGYLIHKLVEALTPGEFPGLKQINAVDAAGVHPLLVAIGSERYMPFRERKPEEILTIANRILGSGQTSLAKFLFIAADGDDPNLDAQDTEKYFDHFLERVDWRRDLHFQTKTTIDTLDYSGSGWNSGSKVVMACCGDPIRKLATEKPKIESLPKEFHNVCLVQKGIIAINGPKFTDYRAAQAEMEEFVQHLGHQTMEGIAMIVVCDDATFMQATHNNFLWATFTRANPSHDIYGVHASIQFKHWGCIGPLVIDARIKPHHAPELVTDPIIADKVDQMFAKGGPLQGII